jgi:hypothetical protein
VLHCQVYVRSGTYTNAVAEYRKRGWKGQPAADTVRVPAPANPIV